MAKSDPKIRKFYGDSSKRTNKTWEQKKIKLERCADDFSKHPILPKRHLRIDDPLPIFETFPRQQMAFDYLKTCQEDVHMFAREKDCDGKRIYIVATLPQFWYKYTRGCSPEDRNYYEVIPEGAACRLYFDLEFKTEFNPGKDGTKMVEIFIKYVCHHLKDMYDVNCNRKCIIDLDSSTTAKFSRHLIFLLPGAVFKDNIHAGNFVRHICKLLERKLGFGSELCKSVDCDSDNPHPTTQTKPLTENLNEDDDSQSVNANSNEGKEDECFASVSLQELQELIIKDGKGNFGTFCDQGVYTKNRNFRIFKSTKIGKNAHLLVSDQNIFKPSFRDRKGSFSKDPEYLLFLDSLVANVSMQVGGKDVKVLTCDSCAKSSKRSSQKGSQDSDSPASSQSGYEHSPYPEIDQFILQVINKGGVQGEIRRWVFFPQGKLLTYDILKNRWCENIGRAHKSNHIMIVADLRLGVYYQKCHDPDCKNIDYRSPERPIPDEINPLSCAQCSEFVSEDWDDQELCKLAAECEDYGDSNSCNSKTQEALHATESNRQGLFSSRSHTNGAQCDINCEDDWDDDSMLQVQALCASDVSEGVGKLVRNMQKHHKKTLEEFQGNEIETREGLGSLDNGTNRPTLNDEEPIAAMRLSNQDIGHLESVHNGNGATKTCEKCRGLSQEECSCENNKLVAISDEDVYGWLDEDPVSDLELSFAAEEAESTAYQ
ncbi:hypothetical protein ACROYT_G004254 [Oculina patagonica]